MSHKEEMTRIYREYIGRVVTETEIRVESLVACKLLHNHIFVSFIHDFSELSQEVCTGVTI